MQNRAKIENEKALRNELNMIKRVIIDDRKPIELYADSVTSSGILIIHFSEKLFIPDNLGY